MPMGLLKKLKLGVTKTQIKARTERAKKRKVELDRLMEEYFTGMNSDRMKEYETLEELLAAFRSGVLVPADPNPLRVYLHDWRRKAGHGGTQSWYALIGETGVTEFVVWHMVGKNQCQGYKAWSLRDTTFEEALGPLL
jgi:hypothetical protein